MEKLIVAGLRAIWFQPDKSFCCTMQGFSVFFAGRTARALISCLIEGNIEIGRKLFSTE